MKKIITICAAVFMTASVFAQAPQKMSYQAIVRDGTNALVTSASVGMQISILQGSTSGTAVYVETQTPTSNANGLVTIEIGGGTLVSGDFSTIDWANGPYFIVTETDPTGGTSYTITGTSQLLSVPYALHAKTVEQEQDTTYWKVNGNEIFYNNSNVGIGTSTPGARLDVQGTIRRSESTGTKSIELGFAQAEPSMVFNNYSTDIRSDIRMINASGDIRFSTGPLSGGSTAQSVKLLISGTGVISVNDVLNITPRTTAPSFPNKGDMYMDDTTNKLMVYDGTTWQTCW